MNPITKVTNPHIVSLREDSRTYVWPDGTRLCIECPKQYTRVEGTNEESIMAESGHLYVINSGWRYYVTTPLKYKRSDEKNPPSNEASNQS